MKKGNSELTEKQRATLKALEELPDDRIDTTDIPEVLDWSNARRGVFYRPVKQQITLRLDADVIAWFRARVPGRARLPDRHQPRPAPARRALRKGEDRMTDWESCEAVERHADKLGGAWVFQGTRVPVSALFENLRDGATVEQFLEWFPGVAAWTVEAVLDREAQALTDHA